MEEIADAFTVKE